VKKKNLKRKYNTVDSEVNKLELPTLRLVKINICVFRVKNYTLC